MKVIMAIGVMIKWKDMEYTITLVELSIVESGWITSIMAKESMSSQMEAYMMVNGKNIGYMVKESILIEKVNLFSYSR